MVFFDITAGGEALGRITMELKADVTPRTAEVGPPYYRLPLLGLILSYIPLHGHLILLFTFSSTEFPRVVPASVRAGLQGQPLPCELSLVGGLGLAVGVRKGESSLGPGRHGSWGTHDKYPMISLFPPLMRD